MPTPESPESGVEPGCDVSDLVVGCSPVSPSVFSPTATDVVPATVGEEAGVPGEVVDAVELSA